MKQIKNLEFRYYDEINDCFHVSSDWKEMYNYFEYIDGLDGYLEQKFFGLWYSIASIDRIVFMYVHGLCEEDMKNDITLPENQE